MIMNIVVQYYLYISSTMILLIKPGYWCDVIMPCTPAINTDVVELGEEDNEPYDTERAVGVKVINLTKVT